MARDSNNGFKLTPSISLVQPSLTSIETMELKLTNHPNPLFFKRICLGKAVLLMAISFRLISERITGIFALTSAIIRLLLSRVSDSRTSIDFVFEISKRSNNCSKPIGRVLLVFSKNLIPKILSTSLVFRNNLLSRVSNLTPTTINSACSLN